MYCIFSTLPLDVENTVNHTQDSKGGCDCKIREYSYILHTNNYIFSTLPLDVENIVFVRRILKVAVFVRLGSVALFCGVRRVLAG